MTHENTYRYDTGYNMAAIKWYTKTFVKPELKGKNI